VKMLTMKSEIVMKNSNFTKVNFWDCLVRLLGTFSSIIPKVRHGDEKFRDGIWDDIYGDGI
jgi:hypothetical protein